MAYTFIGVVLIYIFLLLINTMLRNDIPILNQYGVFYFDYEWGTRRGAILQEAYWVFRREAWWQKLIGSGPDTFWFQLEQTVRAMRIHNYIFGDSRLTNAHCELFTILVNQGILGAISFAGIFVCVVKKMISYCREDSELTIYVLVIAMYLSNNLISFQTILNTPLLFVILGVGASQVVSKKRAK